MKHKFLLAVILLTLAVQALLAQPVITSFSPTSGPVGTLITLTGSNLSNPTAFSIGGRAALVISNTGTQLVGYVMPGAATGGVSVSTAAGTANSTVNFTLVTVAVPSIQKGDPIIAPPNNELLGSSVALSADGKTAIVGAPYYRNSTGAAVGQTLIYTYNNGSWSQQAEFSASAYYTASGSSVALSADGNTAMVGGPFDDSTQTGNTQSGAIWFFTRNGNTWTEQGKPVIPSDYTGSADIGNSCSLSADGNTAIFGGATDNHNLGAAWIYTRSGGLWTQVGSKLLPSDGVGSYVLFGQSVAMSADGNTAVIGGSGDNSVLNPYSIKGATWVFIRSGNTWKQQGSKLVASGNNPTLYGDQQGISVGVSADGNTLVTTGPGSNSVWVFTRSGSLWTQLGQPFTVSGIQGDPEGGTGAPYTGFGDAVALSADGNTVMVGDPSNGYYNDGNDYPPTGGTWLFTRSGSTYAQQQGPVLGTGTGTSPHGQQGNAVALSADGTTAMIGGTGNGGDFAYYGGAWFLGVNNLQSQTITFAPLQNKAYGSADINPGATSTNNTIPITYTSSNTKVAIITAAGTIHITGAGTTTIAASQAGSAVYSPATPVPQPFTVTAVPLTVTANNASKDVGAANPVFTASYSGFVNGDGVVNLTQAATITSTATTSSPAGYYPITASNVIDPNYTFTYVQGKLAVAVSKNDYLSALSLENPHATLTSVAGPGFANYTASVNNTVTSISVFLITADQMATVTVNGQAVTSGTASLPFALSVGPNTLSVIVKAQNNISTRSYIITVTRAASNNANLAVLTLNGVGPLTPVFAPGTTGYTTSVGNGVSSTTATVKTGDPGATVKVNGTTVASGGTSGTIHLNVGTNTITAVVLAADHITSKTYTVKLTRSPSTNANLSSLVFSKGGALTPVFVSTTNSYTLDVNNTVSTITATPKTTDPTATVSINGTAVTSGTASGNITLNIGPNTITTVVTAQDNVTQKTYTVTITRAPSNNANLGVLVSSAGPLTPVFSPTVTSYSQNVSNTVTSVTITPKTSDPTATVTINGAAVTSGTASLPISLNPGPNTITAVVTAEDMVTKQTYTLTVNVAAGPENVPDDAISVAIRAGSPQLAGDGITVHRGVSPNGDGIDDFLRIDGITNYHDNKLTIMDRNGALIYEAKGYDNSTKVFDGHSNKTGAMQLPGTYFFSLDYTANGVIKHKTGFIVLKY